MSVNYVLLVIYKRFVKLVNSFVAVKGRSVVTEQVLYTKFPSVMKSVDGGMRSLI
jgi:hypothetical protein